jgi:hypothetical protein
MARPTDLFEFVSSKAASQAQDHLDHVPETIPVGGGEGGSSHATLPPEHFPLANVQANLSHVSDNAHLPDWLLSI